MSFSNDIPEKPEEKFSEGEIAKPTNTGGLTPEEKAALTRRVLLKLDLRHFTLFETSL